jgi:hypothetical protein
MEAVMVRPPISNTRFLIIDDDMPQARDARVFQNAALRRGVSNRKERKERKDRFVFLRTRPPFAFSALFAVRDVLWDSTTPPAKGLAARGGIL